MQEPIAHMAKYFLFRPKYTPNSNRLETLPVDMPEEPLLASNGNSDDPSHVSHAGNSADQPTSFVAAPNDERSSVPIPNIKRRLLN